MTSALKSRLNHYEMLGVAPDADADTIARAFARETNVLRPQVFGAITELCVAYQTLRDPAKRRAYDASIGLKPKPERPALPYWSTPRPISARMAQQPGTSAAPVANPTPQPQPEVKRTPDRPEAPSGPAAMPRPEPRPAPRADPELPRLFVSGEDPNAGHNAFEWRRIAMAASGLIATAVLAGGLVGWWSGSDAVDAQTPEPTAAAATEAPTEKKPPTLAELWTEPAEPVVKARVDQPSRAASSRIQARRPVRKERQLASSEAEAELIKPPADLADTVPAYPPAPDAAAAPTAAAKMPLPHRTVARTIDRIGYRCGSVASATPVDGAAGVYKVDCTSGQSFQARPVNGRYRFRRLGS